jgi:hypothetical protein
MEAHDMAEAATGQDEVAVVETVGDVSVVHNGSRDPDSLAREIEQTRAELADTIDAIVDRMSPKRAAARGASAVRGSIASARGAISDEPATTPSAAPTSHAGTTTVPVVPIAAAVTVVALVVVFMRRRRRR